LGCSKVEDSFYNGEVVKVVVEVVDSFLCCCLPHLGDSRDDVGLHPEELFFICLGEWTCTANGKLRSGGSGIDEHVSKV